MTLKHIVVHVDDSNASKARVTLAAALANQHEAHLTGLYRVPEIDPRVFMEPAIGAATLDQIMAEVQREAAAAQTLFTSIIQAAGVEGEWRNASAHFASGLSVDTLYSDLVVSGQAAAGEVSPVAEALLVGSGRPTLLVPHVETRTSELKRILIAWTETREASRAVHDALPILAKSELVQILSVATKDTDIERARTASTTLAHHLAQRGIRAEAHHLLSANVEISETLLSRAADFQSDLLVMGAYGHSKLREMVLGGATRGLLERMTLPVLMSH